MELKPHSFGPAEATLVNTSEVAAKHVATIDARLWPFKNTQVAEQAYNWAKRLTTNIQTMLGIWQEQWPQLGESALGQWFDLLQLDPHKFPVPHIFADCWGMSNRLVESMKRCYPPMNLETVFFTWKDALPRQVSFPFFTPSLAGQVYTKMSTGHLCTALKQSGMHDIEAGMWASAVKEVMARAGLENSKDNQFLLALHPFTLLLAVASLSKVGVPALFVKRPEGATCEDPNMDWVISTIKRYWDDKEIKDGCHRWKTFVPTAWSSLTYQFGNIDIEGKLRADAFGRELAGDVMLRIAQITKDRSNHVALASAVKSSDANSLEIEFKAYGQYRQQFEQYAERIREAVEAIRQADVESIRQAAIGILSQGDSRGDGLTVKGPTVTVNEPEEFVFYPDFMATSCPEAKRVANT